jgi:hypothetical protein
VEVREWSGGADVAERAAVDAVVGRTAHARHSYRNACLRPSSHASQTFLSTSTIVRDCKHIAHVP